jgi:hypothetical protein
MKIIPVSIKFDGNTKDLQKLKFDLEKDGFPSSNFTPSRRSLILDFGVNGKGFEKLPICVRDAKQVRRNNFLPLLEKGGATNLENGKAQIVCGMKGEKLKPYHVDKSTAYFKEKEAVLISVENNGGENVSVRIESFKTEEKEYNIYGKRSLIFEGLCKKRWFDDDFSETIIVEEFLSLPYVILFFYFAVREAVRKSRCVGCKRIHYAETKHICGIGLPNIKMCSSGTQKNKLWCLC